MLHIAPDLSPNVTHYWKPDELRCLLKEYAEQGFNQPAERRIVPVRLALRPKFCPRCAITPSNISGCGKCGHAWTHREYHTVTYKRGCGAFILCHNCWAKSTRLERLAYYQERLRLELTEDARGQSAYWPGEATIGEIIDRALRSLEDWPLIEAAVLAEP